MTTTTEGSITVLTPEGNNYLTDGAVVVSNSVYLGTNDSADNWREVTPAEAAYISQKAARDEADALVDKKSSLRDQVHKLMDAAAKNVNCGEVMGSVGRLGGVTSVNELKDKVNEVIVKLSGVVSMVLLSFSVFAASVATAPLGEIYSDVPVVTNVSLSGLATSADIESVRDEIPDTSEFITDTEADAAYYPKSEGDLWSSWWSGDDFRVTVTNYNVDVDSSTVWGRLPWARFEYRTLDTVGNTNYLRTVWDESTRWNRFLDEYATYTNVESAAIAAAPSLWGNYTPTGFDAPEGYTWIDTPATVIAGGLAYQKTVTSDGAIWVLCSNGLTLETSGVDTNGFFRIEDDEGNSVFEVVKGDKRTVGATAGSVYTWQDDSNRTRLRVVYNIESSAAPVLQVAKTLDGTWYSESDASAPVNFAGWTGSSGAWTNAVWGKTSEPSLFVKATYEVGGDTYIRNAAPVSMQYIMLNGKKYSLGTATISGNTVLTLTEAN